MTIPSELISAVLVEILANQLDLRSRIDALECLVKAHLSEGSPSALGAIDASLEELRKQTRENLELKLEDSAGSRLAALVSQALERGTESGESDDGAA